MEAAIPWGYRLHQDVAARVAPNLRAAFAALCLEQDPLAPLAEFFTGQSLSDYLDERRRLGLDVRLREKAVDHRSRP